MAQHVERELQAHPPTIIDPGNQQPRRSSGEALEEWSRETRERQSDRRLIEGCAVLCAAEAINFSPLQERLGNDAFL